MTPPWIRLRGMAMDDTATGGGALSETVVFHQLFQGFRRPLIGPGSLAFHHKQSIPHGQRNISRKSLSPEVALFARQIVATISRRVTFFPLSVRPLRCRATCRRIALGVQPVRCFFCRRVSGRFRTEAVLAGIPPFDARVACGDSTGRQF